ncbi:MAG: CBS domain-containing protein [Chloroflexota bacterium]
MAEQKQSQVKDFMTVRTARIRHNSNIQHAAEIVALSGVSDLMVVDEQDNFRGVLSEGDILRTALPDIDEILEEGGSLDDAFEIFLRKGYELSDLPIAPLIIEDPILVKPDDHVAKAATVLLDKQIRLLPVVDSAGKLVGTISRADVCRAVVGTL